MTRPQRLKVQALLGLLGLAITASGCAEVSSSRPPQSAPSSATATPSADPSPAATPLTVEELSIDASMITNPEALAKTFMEERIQSWFGAGGTPEAFQRMYEGMETAEETAARVVAQTDPVYIEALFGPDWQTAGGDTTNFIQRLKEIHYTTVILYLSTFPGEDNLDDKEAYARFTHVRSVEVAAQTDSEITLIVEVNDSDNSDKNRVGDGLASAVDTNSVARSYLTWRVHDDRLILVDKVPAA